MWIAETWSLTFSSTLTPSTAKFSATVVTFPMNFGDLRKISMSSSLQEPKMRFTSFGWQTVISSESHHPLPPLLVRGGFPFYIRINFNKINKIAPGTPKNPYQNRCIYIKTYMKSPDSSNRINNPNGNSSQYRITHQFKTPFNRHYKNSSNYKYHTYTRYNY